MSARIREYLFESAEILEKCLVFENDMIEAAQLIAKTFVNDGRLLIVGNGGSCADAQHVAGELVSKFTKDRRALPAIALPSSLPTLTAASNDYGYNLAMAREVDAFGRTGDILWAISTSGNSKNVLQAIEIAKARGMKIFGFTGESGGEMEKSCDILFNVPSQSTPIIQQGHHTIAHLICELIENLLPDREYLPEVKVPSKKYSFKNVLNRIKKEK
jgi:D-sedoheptulose 7-phosphate isomerase